MLIYLPILTVNQWYSLLLLLLYCIIISVRILVCPNITHQGGVKSEHTLQKRNEQESLLHALVLVQ
jgi:hypothetical protein